MGEAKSSAESGLIKYANLLFQAHQGQNRHTAKYPLNIIPTN